MNHTDLNEKLINQSKKEVKNFVKAKLKIKTQEEYLRKLWELFHLLEVKYNYVSFWDN